MQIEFLRGIERQFGAVHGTTLDLWSIPSGLREIQFGFM